MAEARPGSPPPAHTLTAGPASPEALGGPYGGGARRMAGKRAAVAGMRGPGEGPARRRGGARRAARPVWEAPPHLSAAELARLNVSLMTNADKFDVLLGCTRCRHSREGCAHCRERPRMVRRKARWDPARARPQRAFCKDAPVFHPTEEEFALGPVGYLEKVYKAAEPYGILCVVPPPSWDPPFVLDRHLSAHDSDNAADLRFPTRVQHTSKLQRRGPYAPEAPASADSSLPLVHDSDSSSSSSDSEEEGKAFGFGHGARMQTLRSFRRYDDWLCETHFENAAAAAAAAAPRDPTSSSSPSSPSPSKRMRMPSTKLDAYDAPSATPRTTWGDATTSAIAASAPIPPSADVATPSTQKPTAEQIEAEFWRIVEDPSPDQEVEVLYGADLHTAQYGSGFPGFPRRGRHAKGTEGVFANNAARTPDEQRADEGYATHLWNVNMFPLNPSALLRHVSGSRDIPGVTVPWMYIGSALTSFSWHIEDHALCSVNYLAYGAPKVWYGVPGTEAGKFEAAMRSVVPKLFEKQSHLLYNLTTMVSPEQLSRHGVTVSRLVCPARCFVITLPNAYHGGVNVGFNAAESVNFAPPLWLDWGAAVVERYKRDGRAPSLSHDHLLITLARQAYPVGDGCPYSGGNDDPKVDGSDAEPPVGARLAEERVLAGRSKPPQAAVRVAVDQLRRRVTAEIRARAKALDAPGVNLRQMRGGVAGGRCRKTRTLLDLAERECTVCHADLYLSGVVCEVHPRHAVCVEHASRLCCFDQYRRKDDGDEGTDDERSDVEDDERLPCCKANRILLYRHAVEELKYRCGMCS